MNGPLLRWQDVFGPTTLDSSVTLPANSRVVVSGCALGGALAVGRITIPAGSAVRAAQRPRPPRAAAGRSRGNAAASPHPPPHASYHTTHRLFPHLRPRQLIIADQPLALAVRNIAVDGALVLGAEGCPLASRVTVAIPGGDAAFGIDVSKAAGALDVHGTVVGPTWTRLTATVAKDARALPLREAVSWRPGDKLVLTSTTWRDETNNQNEARAGGGKGVGGEGGGGRATAGWAPAIALRG